MTLFFFSVAELSNSLFNALTYAILAVSAIADNLKEAIDKAYNAAAKIDFQGAYSRKDIGAKALKVLEPIS